MGFLRVIYYGRGGMLIGVDILIWYIGEREKQNFDTW